MATETQAYKQGMLEYSLPVSSESDNGSTSQSDSDSASTVSDILPDIPLPPPSKAPTEILSVDRDTPDNHVPRDPRLIRLTGVHPFNVEPPLTTLFKEGTSPTWLSLRESTNFLKVS